MKLMTILGTRPEIIRLSRVMARLDETPGIEHVIVHTGQNYDYELNEVFFEELEVRSPDHFLNVSRNSVGQAYGDILAKSEAIMLDEQPDAVLILGDTNSAIAAIIAKRLHIPVFHMEAGNRSFDQNVPEEVNRRIVDHTADINITYTEHARRNLIAEGLPARRIYVSGSPMLEVIQHHRHAIDRSTILSELQLEQGQYFVASLHREENVDHPERLRSALAALGDLADLHDLPVVLSLHPRTRSRLEQQEDSISRRIRMHKPFGFLDYCKLQLDSACVLSDSGTIAEESSMLGFPAITMRDSIERPEALDTGSIVLAGVDSESVKLSTEFAMGQGARPIAPNDYQIPNSAERVVALIIGLTGRHGFWSGLHRHQTETRKAH